MKLTKEKLRQIIKEELSELMAETDGLEEMQEVAPQYHLNPNSRFLNAFKPGFKEQNPQIYNNLVDAIKQNKVDDRGILKIDDRALLTALKSMMSKEDILAIYNFSQQIKEPSIKPPTGELGSTSVLSTRGRGIARGLK